MSYITNNDKFISIIIVYQYTISWELCYDEQKINYMPEMDILRNSSQIYFGCPELAVTFEGLAVQKDTQTPSWLRL